MDVLQLLPMIYSKFILYTLIFTRISALLSTFVLLQREMITTRIIASLSFIFSCYVLLGMGNSQFHYDVFSVQMLAQVLYQMFIGLITATILNIVFEVFIAVGQIISGQMGLSIASIVDPRFGYVTSLSHFYLIVCSLLFLYMNGHLYVIKTIVDSFSTIPVNQLALPAHLMTDILNYAGVIFSSSILLSINLVMLLLLTNIALAVMTKFAPQFNLFTIGINMELIIGLICIYVTFNLFINNGSDVIQANIDFFTQAFTKMR